AFQNRVLIEIVANDFGHKGIDSLVVGDSRPQRICEGYVSGAIGIEETLSTERGSALEYQGVEIIVVDSAIDHIDALQAEGGSHINDIIVHHQISPLDEFNAHPPR